MMKNNKSDLTGFFLRHLSIASRIIGKLVSFRYVLLLLLVVTAAMFFAVNVSAVPSAPQINYISNSTYVATSVNRSIDQKGTITVVTLDSNQQDYKWKAYVGNVSGSLVLDDANSKSVYDWSLTTVTGEVYVSRSSSVTWTSVSCVNQTVIDNEQSFLGMTSSARDSINSTFNYTSHRSFLIGTNNITSSSCRSTATYINDAAQTINEAAKFQEILLRDNIGGGLIYATLLEQNQAAYDGVNTYDFQLIVAENESATVPTNYYFYVELG
jgi:hypothetical protein